MTRMRTDWGVAPSEHEEGTITKGIEQFTSQAPSGTYLTAAVACMAVSAMLQLAGRKQEPSSSASGPRPS